MVRLNMVLKKLDIVKAGLYADNYEKYGLFLFLFVNSACIVRYGMI